MKIEWGDEKGGQFGKNKMQGIIFIYKQKTLKDLLIYCVLGDLWVGGGRIFVRWGWGSFHKCVTCVKFT